MPALPIKFALVAVAIAAAAPAGAQYYPSPPNWGFGYERYGDVRYLKIRMDKVQGLIRAMDWRHQITGRSAARLIEEADAIQRHLRNDAAYGLTKQEAAAIHARVLRIEREVDAAYAERDRRLRDPFESQNPDWRRDADRDLDRNGRDDRWEDDYRVNAPAGPPR